MGDKCSQSAVMLYKDRVGNTVEQNPGIFSLIQMH